MPLSIPLETRYALPTLSRSTGGSSAFFALRSLIAAVLPALIRLRRAELAPATTAPFFVRISCSLRARGEAGGVGSVLKPIQV